MALGDYILCCKCEIKLIYDGDRGNREWWAERFGSEPEIKCPNCEQEAHVDGNDTSQEHVDKVGEKRHEPVEVDRATMELAESVGLIGPASRTHDLHNAIQRFHDLICANATIKAAVAFSRTLEAKDEPVAWATREDFYRELEHAMNRMRQQMEIKSVTMRCTDYDLALPVIDIFDGRILVGQVTTPQPQREWVGLTDEEIKKTAKKHRWHESNVAPHLMPVFRSLEAKLRSKNT